MLSPKDGLSGVTLLTWADAIVKQKHEIIVAVEFFMGEI